MKSPIGSNFDVLPMPEVGEESLDWVARMTILHDDYNFVPTTGQERNVAFVSIPFVKTPGGVGRHLNEVLIHQRSHEVDQPERAIRSVVQSMGLYRDDAISRREALLDTYHKLDYTNPRLDVRQIDDVPRLGVLSVIQYVDIMNGVRGKDNTPIKGSVMRLDGKKRLVSAYDEATHDEHTVDIMIDRLDDKSVLAIRGLVLAAGKSHAARRKFWDKLLVSSQSHAIARPIVRKLLDQS